MFWTYSQCRARARAGWRLQTVTTNDSLQPETARWKPWNRRRDARRGPGAIWPLLFVVSYYSNMGPSQNFSYTLLNRFLKLGEGIPRLVVLVGSAKQPDPRPPKSPTMVEALPARSGAC